MRHAYAQPLSHGYAGSYSCAYQCTRSNAYSRPFRYDNACARKQPNRCANLRPNRNPRCANLASSTDRASDPGSCPFFPGHYGPGKRNCYRYHNLYPLLR